MLAGCSCQEYMDFQLVKGASVNGFEGMVLRLSAEQRPETLFLQLIQNGPSRIAISQAMPYLMRAKLAAEKLVCILRHCFGLETGNPDVKTAYDNSTHPILLAITLYPRDPSVIRVLREYGYRAPTGISATLLADVGNESLPVVVWALSREQPISVSVLEELLLAGGDANLASEKTGTNPVLLAAASAQLDTLNALISNGALVDTANTSGLTPLSCASKLGHAAIVGKLCDVGALTDDGSLHEAARELNSNVVLRLLQAGHEPDFPSGQHEGRSALLEMLLKSCIQNPEHRRQVVLITQNLRSIGVDRKLTFGGKSAIFCAMENEFPVEMTGAFLDTDEWKCLNGDHNLYQDATGLCYSPTMYIENGLWKGNARYRASLLQLLRNKRCADKYFSLNGPQPDGARGLPLHLEEEEKLRKEKAERLNTIREEHTLALTRQRERQDVDLEDQRKRHTLIMQHDRDRTREQRLADEVKHRQAIEHDKNHALARQAIQCTENETAMLQQAKLIRLHEAQDNLRVEREKLLLGEQDKVAERQHQRKLQEVASQSERDRERHRLVTSAMNTQRKLMSSQARSPLLQLDRKMFDDETVD